jgi:hypothetical protein
MAGSNSSQWTPSRVTFFHPENRCPRVGKKDWTRYWQRWFSHQPQSLRQRYSGRPANPIQKDTITPTKRSTQVETCIIGAFLAHGFAECSLRHLSASAVAQYRDEHLNKVKSGTVRQELNVLQHYFKMAHREWNIPLSTTPVSQIAMPQASKPRNRKIII